MAKLNNVEKINISRNILLIGIGGFGPEKKSVKYLIYLLNPDYFSFNMYGFFLGMFIAQFLLYVRVQLVMLTPP